MRVAAVRSKVLASLGGAFAALLLGAALPAGAAEAAPEPPKADLAKGQELASQVCAACHNADGNSTIATNPKLAGLPAEYIYKQLVDLARKPDDKLRREQAAMSVYAQQLSDPDRRNVAAYFASQVPKPGAAHDKDLLDDGQRIYRTGVPERGVPACAGCHGPAGAGLPVLYPRLAGQHAEYVEGQLKAWREGTRRNSEAMVAISTRLRENEAKAVADYIAGLHRQP